ncbi:DUF6907 domain-containing protein [Streptomyces sp. WAC01280]|uniref:DUF6907 domain-containing protein n=1 Tax=Streptomyces sp. WAC01280 TaxID=2487424 RepID=UPI000F7866CE|nr:hypothetical protein [Streptomyces sp. WAC01280]RSS53026.1 hypothetical protein EF909_26225 [Streptomyces sp. WAC01280]
MSDTVQRAAHSLPGNLPAAFLPGIPQQPQRSSVSMKKAPRTWTFTDRETGEEKTFTCMVGCTDDHSEIREGVAVADDVWCLKSMGELTLPINEHGQPEELSVLRATMNVDPFDRRMAQRLPHIDLEVMDGAFIEGLDPDGFETVINSLQHRLDQLRAMRADLVATRAAYIEQAQR